MDLTEAIRVARKNLFETHNLVLRDGKVWATSSTHGPAAVEAAEAYNALAAHHQELQKKDAK